MNKAVLISIKPKWCELIASGKKTDEVRKTKPKLETPFKVYIYCTLQGSNEFFKEVCKGDVAEWNRSRMAHKKGKVIGEFVCDAIKEITADNLVAIYFNNPQESTCLNDLEMRKYANGKNLFLWRISSLVIYDNPRSLSEFYNKCEMMACEGCEHLKYQQVNSDKRDYDCEYLNGNIPLSRPPQSWCYVEKGGAE